MCSMPGSALSSRKLPWPSIEAGVLVPRATRWPMPPISAVVVGFGWVVVMPTLPQLSPAVAAAAARIALTMFM